MSPARLPIPPRRDVFAAPPGTGKPNAVICLPKSHAPSRARTRSGRWKATFLRALTKSPSITLAAKAAGIPRRTVYDNRERDPAFAQAWDDALNQSIDRLEHEAYRFALTLEGGEPGTASARGRMAEFLLKAHRPAVYRERVEAAVAGGIIILPGKAQGSE